jgi:hypothetical protein
MKRIFPSEIRTAPPGLSRKQLGRISALTERAEGPWKGPEPIPRLNRWQTRLARAGHGARRILSPTAFLLGTHARLHGHGCW